MSGTTRLDATHDPDARSWVESANRPNCDFPIQNLPIAVFRRAQSTEDFRGGIAIGDHILDLAAAATAGIFEGDAAKGVLAGAKTSLNSLMQLGAPSWHALRRALFEGLLAGSARRSKIEPCLVPQRGAQYALPAQIGDFTDFYTSIHHATAVGRIFRPDNPLPPNYKWIPLGYHGRSSSIGVSGQTLQRPRGQWLPPGAAAPSVSPSLRLDYELELGLFIGTGNSPGVPIGIADAERHIFGMCLLNDWSARDLQAWEYQPLGPFLAKNFATTISPWIVTLEALAPFRVAASRPETDPQPLAHLTSPRDRSSGGLDIRIEASIQSEAMLERHEAPHLLSSTSFRHAYWTIAQLVAHHTSNGCNLRAGDLLGTGTQSGPTPAEAGSLLELSQGGRRPIKISGDEERAFLQDGDTVIFRGWCEKPGAARIGFGEVRGRVLPALETE